MPKCSPSALAPILMLDSESVSYLKLPVVSQFAWNSPTITKRGCFQIVVYEYVRFQPMCESVQLGTAGLAGGLIVAVTPLRSAPFAATKGLYSRRCLGPRCSGGRKDQPGSGDMRSSRFR